MLAWTVYLSFLGSAGLLLLPTQRAAAARMLALLSALSGFGVALVGAFRFVPGPEVVTLIDLSWVPSLGLRFHLAVDGISLVLVVLTGLAALVGVLFSWNIEH